MSAVVVAPTVVSEKPDAGKGPFVPVALEVTMKVFGEAELAVTGKVPLKPATDAPWMKASSPTSGTEPEDTL